MVYILYGENPSQISWQIDEIKRNTSFDDFRRFDMQENSLDEILCEMDMSSLFDDTELILIDNALCFSGKKEETDGTAKKGKRKKGDPLSPSQLALQEFSKRNPDNKIIIYINPTGSAKRNLAKTIPFAQIIPLKPLKEEDLRKQILHMIQSRNIQMDQQASSWFFDNMGDDLVRISSELDKLKAYSISMPVLHLQDLQTICDPEPEKNNFALTDALFKRNTPRILELYRNFRFQGLDTGMITGLIASQIRFIFQVRYLMDSGFSKNQIAGELNTSAGRIYFCMEKARLFQCEELLDMLEQLADLDWQIKTGKSDKDTAFESFVLDLQQS